MFLTSKKKLCFILSKKIPFSASKKLSFVLSKIHLNCQPERVHFVVKSVEILMTTKYTSEVTLERSHLSANYVTTRAQPRAN